MNWAPMIEQVVKAYQNHLGEKYGDQTLIKYNHLHKSNEEAAISEAIVFNWLYGNELNPELRG